MNKINNEALEIRKTFIKYFPHSDMYHLEVQDQYDRWWIYRGADWNLSLDEAEKIEAEELRKGIINLDLYHFDDDRIIERIKRQEKVLYVYSYSKGEHFDDRTFIDEAGACVAAITDDGIEYVHDKVFQNYEDLKEFALKIKAKGIINLEFWRCIGSYDWEGNSYLEFEEDDYYQDESSEWSSRDIYNSLGGEDGERKYMSDGAWISPDGTITFDR